MVIYIILRSIISGTNYELMHYNTDYASIKICFKRVYNFGKRLKLIQDVKKQEET